MLYLSLFALLPVLFLLYRVLKRPSIHRNGRRLPRPSDSLPILGNAIRFLQPRHLLFDWFVKQQTAFNGNTFEIAVPSLPPGVVINSSENVEYVLKHESAVTKGDFFRERSWDLFGYGIINATGELWRLQRKAGLKFFSGDNLSAMIEEVLPAAYEKTHATLSQHAQSGEVFDLQRICLDLTTSVVGQMAYDMDFDASSPFSKAFDYASDHIALRFQNPLYPLTELLTGSKFRAAVREVKLFGKKIVSNARKRRGHEAMESLINDTGEPQFGSLIDSLIETLGEPDVVADAAMNFLSAGRDTTAQSITWTFYALLRHPEILAKLRTEIENLTNTDTETLTMSDLQPTTIPYTTAVFYESLRLYPPVPIEIKQCIQPVTLPDGTTLPEDAIVVWCIWALNRSTNLYGADAATFRPERWLDAAGRFQGKTAYEFPVFNGGPRACLGKKMAELMAAWVLLVMVSEFDFEEEVVVVVAGATRSTDASGRVGVAAVEERVSQNSLTLPMRGGLPCRVRLRAGVWAGPTTDEEKTATKQTTLEADVE